MRLKSIRLSDYRNIEFVELNFDSNFVFFFGKNAQGKTNLLEAISLMTALRSFRTKDTRSFVRHTKKSANIYLEVEHELEGKSKILLSFFSDGTKKAECDEISVKRLSDLFARFPVLVFSSEDISLLRGAPSIRRRWLDYTISMISPDYFLRLQAYSKALDSRNKILKNLKINEFELNAFEQILAENGTYLYQERKRFLEILNVEFISVYERIVAGVEKSQLSYKPSLSFENVQDWVMALKKNRDQDKFIKFTQKGSHRDDIEFILNDKRVEEFASEGQQRVIVLALGLARLEIFKKKLNVSPIVIIDDVLLELDGVRKKAFWDTLGAELQIFASGTILPETNSLWTIFNVEDGKYSL